MLGFLSEAKKPLISKTVKNENSKIIEPCFIGGNVLLKNSEVGPYASIGDGTIVENSTLKNSIVQKHSKIMNANLDNAIIGNNVNFDAKFINVSIGDYS